MTVPAAAHGYIGPFAGIDVPWLVATRARSRRDHPFLIWEPFDGVGETLTYGAFDDRVGRLAAGLARRGLRAGDFLLVHLDNCLETILAWYAAERVAHGARASQRRAQACNMSFTNTAGGLPPAVERRSLPSTDR